MSWNGEQAGIEFMSGNVVVTTNGSGQATISFGVTFPREPHVVAMGGNSESVTISYGAGVITTTGFTATFYNQAGATINSGGVRCIWIARCPRA